MTDELKWLQPVPPPEVGQMFHLSEAMRLELGLIELSSIEDIERYLAS